jgi:hypothetical protein
MHIDLLENDDAEPLPFDHPDYILEPEEEILNILVECPPSSSSSSSSTSTTTSQRSRKRTRHVSFEETPTAEIIQVPSFACLAEEQRRDLWYRQDEIEEFRAWARETCRKLREDPSAYSEEFTRGLELRASLDRQWRKSLALSCILKAQKRFPKIEPSHLAAIARRCTAIPREDAIQQATRDFCSVYYPDWTSFLPATDYCVTSKAVLNQIQSQFHLINPKRLRRSSQHRNNHHNKENNDDICQPPKKRQRSMSKEEFECLYTNLDLDFHI